MTMKSILAAGASLLTLAAVSAAEAKTVGHVSGSGTYVSADIDAFSGKNLDQFRFNFNGAAGFDLSPTWNVQFDVNFTTSNFTDDAIFSGKDISIDTWQAGTQLFWRDPSQGLVGVQVAYSDFSFATLGADGFLAGLRGEYYGSDQYTIGGAVSYNSVGFGGSDINTTTGSLFVTYYSGTQTAISLRGEYGNFDTGSSSDLDTWALSADVEYLLENNLSLTGGVGYGSTDLGSADLEEFNVMAKLKVYFGTEGTIANQHRTSTLEPIPVSDFLLPF